MKVKFNDKRLTESFCVQISVLSAFATLILAFFPISKENQILFGVIFFLSITILYLLDWVKANRLKSIEIKIEGSIVCVKEGDIFKEKELKVIAFNEYFDTQVDDQIISKSSLNGIYIKHFVNNPSALDKHIEDFPFMKSNILDVNNNRKAGKKQRYKLGTIVVHGDYLLTAFSKFNEANEAHLTMPEYLGFLINFWDQINTVYANKSVSTPILGSGITRIKGHKGISDEDLLKIMIWTFRVSEMRFKHPAKLTIIIHPDKLKDINLLDIKSTKNGF
ncbi:DUF6430 domain-containing protein [Acinetobacter faecalis]|uniref:DUF6430 domain-containing protein n=1 Tax=Acinetobacter faecalis TaxID=2665161 RepID=A0AB35UWN2_9GAMM|nr:macro domain-containing protein [Acinetobacter faecalis]MDY6487122.1 DUF6430 domain-containing protein [Acinetobacter faecalis]